MASFRCYGNSDLGEMYPIWNFHLSLAQHLCLIFCWTDNGAALVAQSWTVQVRRLGGFGGFVRTPPLPEKVRLVATNNLIGLKHVSHVYRGYYTVARRYKFYVWVARTTSHEWVQWTSKMLFLPRENKIHIFKPTWNVLFIIWRLKFNKSKRRESWRHWTIRHSQRWHTENTPLGSGMKWRLESTSGLVPSKTISSIK